MPVKKIKRRYTKRSSFTITTIYTFYSLRLTSSVFLTYNIGTVNIHTCNSLGFRQHHKSDNRNVLFLNVYKVHLYLNNAHYKNGTLDDLGEMYYQDLHILHV